MELIDIGANLTNGRFHNDLDAVLERARRAGVAHMVVTGTDIAESRAARELVDRYPGLLSATAGVHPHHAGSWGREARERLEELAAEPGIVAIGETGLDFYRNFAAPADQERAFEAQLELAVEVGLPVFLHERQAHLRFIDILGRYRDRLRGAVLHCFTAGREELSACLELDLHVGITGWICDERRGLHLRDVVRHVPGNRLMLETDSPYLIPRDLRPAPKGGRNEPAFLPHILETVAESLEVESGDLARTATATARAFFNL